MTGLFSLAAVSHREEAMLDAMKFAEEVLGSAGLGDRRLDRRAVINLAILSRRSWRSFVDTCDGDAAAQEGLYRFIRNRRVSADVMIDAGCRATGQQVAQTCLGDILAVMDTTSFGYSHSVASEERGGRGVRFSVGERDLADVATALGGAWIGAIACDGGSVSVHSDGLQSEWEPIRRPVGDGESDATDRVEPWVGLVRVDALSARRGRGGVFVAGGSRVSARW
jgi:hypothetical protein